MFVKICTEYLTTFDFFEDIFTIMDDAFTHIGCHAILGPRFARENGII